MYESELNCSVASVESLPRDIRGKFNEGWIGVDSRTLLPWGEHCMECNWPTCYNTCELYTPRQDGACRLFIGGVTRIDNKGGLNPYLQKIRFKRWAKLWTVGTLNLYPLPIARRKEKNNIFLGAIIRIMPLPAALKRWTLRKFGYLRKKKAEKNLKGATAPDYFVLECYNPKNRAINLSLTIRDRNLSHINAFQKIINVPPGFVLDRTPITDIRKRLDMANPFEVEIVPNDCDDTVLYFGCMDFVKEHMKPAAVNVISPASKTWKCIVWDLDNTLWDGILIEDGPENLRFKHDPIRVIEETDRRGILHSIASKNNHEDALKALTLFGINDYFLYPQISWQPKSESIIKIANQLNIGIDTIAFVDDQPFELEEVKYCLPQISLINASDCATILGRAECRVPVTEESKKRRLMYRQQEQRDGVLENYKGDYMGFLRECNIQLHIGPLREENLERVFELAQRTNQMNYSGNRYPKNQLRQIMTSNLYKTYVIKCVDKYGSYGIVGFAVVAVKEPRLIDLMFSCRVQGKRVEHAFFSFLLKFYVGTQCRYFYADFRRTDKNAQAGRVFEEIGFERVAEQSGVTSLVFKKTHIISDDKIILVAAENNG